MMVLDGVVSLAYNVEAGNASTLPASVAGLPPERFYNREVCPMNVLTVAARAVCRAHYQDREPSPSEWSRLAEALAIHDRRVRHRERAYYRLPAEAGLTHPDGSRAGSLGGSGR